MSKLFVTSLMSIALLASTAAIAIAADMPVKNPPMKKWRFADTVPSPIVPGLYIGAGTGASVAGANAAAPNAGTNLYAAGVGLKGVVGYEWMLNSGLNPLIPSFMFTELSVNWNNMGGTQFCATGISCSIGSTWGVDLGVAVGCNWTAVFTVFPAISSLFGGGGVPAVPGGGTLIASRPYCGGWADFNDISASIGAASGTAWRVSPAAGIGLINVVNIGGAPQLIDTRAKVEFAGAGLTFGAPTGINYGNLGTAYKAEAIIRF